MRAMIMSCAVVILSGCTGIAEQQRAQQDAWDAMTPTQQMVELERRRVAIEQQRANTEQIEAGLRMMQNAQPTFAPPQPAPASPMHCTSQQRYYGGPIETVCN